MDLGLRGKTAIITGGSGAIGAAIGVFLASEGMNVVLSYFSNQLKANDTVFSIQSHGGRAFAFFLDVRDANSVRTFFQSAADRLNGVDLLVNCAGAAFFGKTKDYDEEEWDRVINTNLKGVFLCCKEVIGYFMERGGGDIVNISSLASRIGSFEGVAYAASKAGVNLLTKSLALELATKNIRVNGLAPGRIATPFRRKFSGEYYDFMINQTPLKRMGTAAEIASAVGFIASRVCSFMTGETVFVTGGLHTVFLDHVIPDSTSGIGDKSYQDLQEK